MHKTKKKVKTEKIPKPINIKKEKTEEDRLLHPMSFYVDDRLELVKQVFGTLKPKTITNLAPEFLKKKSLDDIGELCFNELLCISTKRLISIINGTKCPTDTESSEDSDVEHKEEHISLEEISSDSEIETSDLRKVKNKKKKTSAAPNKKELNNINEKNDEPDGQISVLELLELQARARAIRSQLALEPVTKIEVNSDEERAKSEKSTSRKSGKDYKSTRKDHKYNSSDRKEDNFTKKSSTTTGAVEQSHEQKNDSEKMLGKKVKLKRNYRSSSNKEQKRENSTEKSQNPIIKSEDSKSRSQSPDVVPIQVEPETLLICDSSDDDADLKVQKAPEINADYQKERKISEVEDGEITEIDSERTRETENLLKGDLVENQLIAEAKENDSESQPTMDKQNLKEVASEEVATEKLTDQVVEGEEILKIANESSSKQTPATNVVTEINSPKNSELVSNCDEDDDQNDDVISIEGGDLESEMNEELAKVEPSLATENSQQEDVDDDVISLETSEDERDKLNAKEMESWHSRYLKSSKVSQVLAASRLGKRVRDQIKKSKHSKKESEREAKGKEEETFASKHEDGSVEQYMELRQREN